MTDRADIFEAEILKLKPTSIYPSKEHLAFLKALFRVVGTCMAEKLIHDSKGKQIAQHEDEEEAWLAGLMGGSQIEENIQAALRKARAS